MRKFFLYLMAFVYASAGIYHFVNPSFYEAMMPEYIPDHSTLNYAAGISEIILAVLLVPKSTRRISGQLIIAMLAVFLVTIHLPMVKEFYKTAHPALWISIVRLPLQFVLIWWAWYYTKPFES